MNIKNIAGELNPYAKKKLDEAAKQQKTADASLRQQANKASSEGSDVVHLSPEARLRGTALNTATNSSDIRAEKVRELKEQVRNGTYKPDVKKAAANLIRDDLDMLI